MRRLLSRSVPADPAPAPKAVPDVPAVLSALGFTVPRRLELRPRDHSADDQDTKRARRRRCLPVEYGPEFKLSAEVQESLAEVRDMLSNEPHPATWARQVAEMTGEIGAIIADIGRLIDARTAWIPEPTPVAVASGSWLDSITEVAEPLDRPLAAALGRQSLSRNASLSDDVVAQLRELDRAAAGMYERLRQQHTARTGHVRKPRSPLSVSFDQARARNARQLAELHEQHRAELDALWRMRDAL
ncbi:hypothetical protein OG563_09475 [Nocardia vinacea]|uniref:Uncharacterized protein n=1 Tax=Nocardia vinacea TaxID=96468 RepID=A0ABZ1Z1T4_9NOCA|nr:hypothetical protein [Nocardia vinacea]